MSSVATQQIARFHAAMQSTAIGAQVARGSRVWTVVERKRGDGSVALTLRSGRRTFRVVVPVCLTGPCWMDVWLRPVRSAPTQGMLQ